MKLCTKVQTRFNFVHNFVRAKLFNNNELSTKIQKIQNISISSLYEEIIFLSFNLTGKFKIIYIDIVENFCTFCISLRKCFNNNGLTRTNLNTNPIQKYKLVFIVKYCILSNQIKNLRKESTLASNKGFYTRRRVDKNQTEIVKVLKQLGCSVLSLADKGHGCPDLLVGYKAQNYLVEVKGKKGKLTEDQETFFQSWKGAVQVFRDVDDVINFFAPSGLLADTPMLDFSDIK